MDGPNPPTSPPPKVDYTPTITIYKRLLTEFPNYRFQDATYYLLGFCLGEMGEEAQARQALLALVCSNQYKPLDPPSAPPPGDDPYGDCSPVKKDSKFLPEAWTRIGEFHFDAPNELRLAIAAFKKVLEFKDSPYYDRALYKLAWSYYRDNNYPEAIRQFDNLVKYADARKAAGEKVGPTCAPRPSSTSASASPSPTGTATPSPTPRAACSASTSSIGAARTSRTCVRSFSAWATS